METDSNKLERPNKVKYAVNILALAFSMGLVAGLVKAYPYLEELAGQELFMVASILFFGVIFSICIVVLIGQGKNWARILWAGLFSLGLVADIISLLLDGSTIPNYRIYNPIHWLMSVLHILALVLLFQKDSSAWFKSKSASHV